MSYVDTIQRACGEGKQWAKKNKITSDAEAWDKLERADWMLWLIDERDITLADRELRLFACDCAERVLHIFEEKYPDDKRPRRAIEVARLFADGKAMKEKLAAASNSAWAAAMAAALDAARDAAIAAWAASDDASAARAAWAALDAARIAAGAAEAKWQADRLREYFLNPFAPKGGEA